MILLAERGEPSRYGGLWSAPACGVLKDMKLLDNLQAEEGILQLPTRGGFLSPAGFTCKMEAADDDESGDVYPAYAAERSAIEKRLSAAAERAGCTIAATKKLEQLSRSGAGERKGWTATVEGGEVFKAQFVVDCGSSLPKEGNSILHPTTGLVSLGLDGTAPTQVAQAAPAFRAPPAKTYAEAYFLVGPAAGHVDPWTGEVDRNAMLAARYAGIYAAQLLDRGDITEENCVVYHHRCHDDFLHRLSGQARVAAILYRLPFLIDALISIGQARADFLVTAAEALAGPRPRYHFLWPGLAVPAGWEAVMQLLRISSPKAKAE